MRVRLPAWQRAMRSPLGVAAFGVVCVVVGVIGLAGGAIAGPLAAVTFGIALIGAAGTLLPAPVGGGAVPDPDRRGVLFPIAWVRTGALLAGALGFTGCGVSLAALGVPHRAGGLPLVVLGVVTALFFGLCALVLAQRALHGSMVALTPEALRVAGRAGNTTVAWTAVVEVESVTVGHRPHLRVARLDRPDLYIPVDLLACPPSLVARAVAYYAGSPEARADLAAGLIPRWLAVA